MSDLTCAEVRELAAGYVLGALDATELAAVRSHLETCPELHAELAELGGVVPYLAEAVDPVEPPPTLRERVVAAAARELRARGGAPGAAEVPPEWRPAAEARGRPAPSRRVRVSPAASWALGVAAVLVIIALGAWNLVLQRQLGEATRFEQGVVSVLEAAAQPGAQAAILSSGRPTGPRGVAAVSSDGQVHLAVRGLVPTSGSQVYEAWVIPAGGQPIPVGGFTVASDGTATFSTRAGPAAPNATIALTLEPGPNPKAPSSPPVVAGVATAPPG